MMKQLVNPMFIACCMVLSTFTVLLLPTANSTPSCPMRCLCFRTTVRCMFLHLEKVPKVPTDTTVLDLRFNRIRDIPSNQFQNLSQLTTLLLNNNQISEIRSGAFNGLSQLKHLYIYKNRIRDLDPSAFSNLSNLEQLYLHYNYISSISPPMFEHLTNLERLFLQNNQIQRIPVGTFDKLDKLQRLRLDGNALVCDCEMLSFAKMLTLHKDTLAAAVCEHPLEMRGKSVLMMQNMEQQCRMPVFVEEPRDMEVKFGNTAYLRCRVEGGSSNIIWLQNNNEINTQLPPRYSIMNDGTLMIENIQNDDLASYECVVRSDGGQEIKSRRAIVNANEAFEYRTRMRPRFLQLPIDQDITEGQTLVLNCNASGEPKPIISWFHNDKLVFPDSPNEVSRTQLVIRNMKQINVGIYRCMASNSLGNISAVAQITIHVTQEPPTWLVTPSETQQILELGENVTLVCEANNVESQQWLYNGQQIVSNQRVQISIQGTKLEITSAIQEDHGEYSCIASNSAGSIEMITNIKIVSGGVPTFTHNLTNIPSYSVRPGIQVQLPCSAKGNPTPSILWRKDKLTVVETLRVAILSSGTLIISEFDPDVDSGIYECSAFNDHGFITTGPIVIDRNRVVVRPEVEEDIISAAYKQARYEVESAENETVRILFDTSKNDVLSPFELLRLTRFPRGEGRFIARPAEIYERALSIIKEQLEKGMHVNVSKDFSYDDLLTTSQLETLGRLSGCISHRTNVHCEESKCFRSKYRSIDGTCNNLNHTMWGSSYTPFQRLLTAQYENGFNLPKGWTPSKRYNGYSLPSARVVTNKIITTESISPDSNYTHMLMQWGQFLDHDLDHALPSLSIEAFGERISCRSTCQAISPCFPLLAPIGDPRIRTRKCMEFTRSAGVCGSGVTSILFDNIQQREQINQLTAYIDASQVYGSSEEELRALRSPTEPIYLRNGIFMYPDKPLMPFATDDNLVDCRRNFRESDIGCFLGGDVRSNEQVGLLAMHTVWFRQHNFIARKLRDANPFWSDETVFQETRKILGAQMQHISYFEWLPKIVGSLGMAELGPYTGYNDQINPSITNAFATGAMRFGHTLINPTLRRLDENFQTIREGDIPLRQAFFAPWRLVEEGGVDPILRGLFHTPAKLKKSTEFLNSHLTNELFGHAVLVSLDLASMNIQRSRDHGLPSYNEYREWCGLSKANSFDDLKTDIPDRELRNKLHQVYGHVNNIDLWVGGIAEQPSTTDARVGPTLRCLLIDQFRRLRDGDRFWYENEKIFSKEQSEEIKRITLARVLCDNGDSLTRINQDVFAMKSNLVNCNLIPEMRFELWTADDICCSSSPSGAAEDPFCRNNNLFRGSQSNLENRRRHIRSTNAFSTSLDDEISDFNGSNNSLKNFTENFTYAKEKVVKE